MRRRLVYLPIEFSARELESKMLIASALLQLDIDVIIGQQWKIQANLNKLPSGAILFKSYHKIYRDIMRYCKSRDFKVFALEEELFATDELVGVNQVITDGYDGLADGIFVQSLMESKVTKEKAPNTRTMECGNPRADVLKSRCRNIWRSRVEQIQNRFGNYTLINTNFGTINSGWGDKDLPRRAAIQSGVLRPGDAASEELFAGCCEYEKFVLDMVSATIDELGATGELIIVRPHPNEDLEFWRKRNSKNKNLVIIREGSHIPWTLGASRLIHGGCTTGFEAAIAGVPSITFALPGNPYSDMLVSNRVNIAVSNSTELKEVLELGHDRIKSFQNKALKTTGFFGLDDEVSNSTIIANSLAESLSVDKVRWSPKLEDLRNLMCQPDVNQLSRKCSIELGEVARIMNCLRMPAAKGSVEVAEIAKSLFLLSGSNRQYYFTGPIRKRYLPGRLAEEQRAKEAASEVEYRGFISEHRDDFIRSPQAVILHIGWCSRHGKWREGFHWVRHLENSCGDIPFEARVGFIKVADRAGEGAYVRARCRELILQNSTLDTAVALSSATKDINTVAVIGDSHVRYFNADGLEALSGGLWFMERLQIGGASAYGLRNGDSESGARKIILGKWNSISRARKLVFNFGEVDCRRAAWYRSKTNNRSIESCLAESVGSLIELLKELCGDRLGDVVVVGAKPAILDDLTMTNISRFDFRCVPTSLSDRQLATEFFNEQLRLECEEIGVMFRDPSLFCYEGGDRVGFQSEALRFCFDDDVHGNLPFFESKYASLLFSALRGNR